MYIFEAYYVRMLKDEEVVRKIEFCNQFLGTDRECYLYAMGKAFDMKEVGEMLSSLEFVAC